MILNWGDIVSLLIFGITLMAALGVVLSANMVHSALYLVLCFLGIAAVYFDLSAGFLGLVQILVYAGAISVLIIFAIMLVMQGNPKESNPATTSRKTYFAGIFLASLLSFSLAYSICISRLPSLQGQSLEDSIGALAGLLLGPYVVAFEAAALLLLLAVVGAILLAKGAEEQ